MLGHDCHLAIVIDETDSGQAFVLHARAQFERSEIPEVNASLGKSLVELRHQRLVLGPDRPDRNSRAVLKSAGRDVLSWIRANCELWQLAFAGVRAVQDDARV